MFENVGYDPEIWSGWAFGFGIEQPPPGPPDTVGLQSAFERARLEQDRETGQRALSDWCACE